jgi:hypothetical protein
VYYIPIFGTPRYADAQSQFATGDRIGVLLDLDAGWMRLYRSGKWCGPVVSGPLLGARRSAV